MTSIFRYTQTSTFDIHTDNFIQLSVISVSAIRQKPLLSFLLDLTTFGKQKIPNTESKQPVHHFYIEGLSENGVEFWYLISSDHGEFYNDLIALDDTQVDHYLDAQVILRLISHALCGDYPN